MERLLDHLPLPRADARAGHVLGLMVTDSTLHGVLLERSETGTRVVRRLSRRRSSDHSGGPYAGFEEAGIPGAEAESSGDDFTLQFGEGGGSSDLFLGAEFGDLPEASGEPAAAPDFVLELSDLLSECRDAGYEDPVIAFCLSASDVKAIELHVPGAVQAEGGAAPSVETVGHKKLLALLADQYEGVLEKERTAFLPMTLTEEGVPRFQALVGRSTDPIISTLRALHEQDEAMPVVRLVETEPSVYTALARKAVGAEAQEDTLLVRAGAEDTLALFVSGGTLHHSETLRSLTAFDAPETICSRVLLLQDEYGIGDVERVLLLGADHEENLIESFEMFFPDARVESLRGYVPLADDEHLEQADGAALPALSAALQLAGHAGMQSVFDGVNLLPKRLARRRLRMPVSWHVPALYAVLFVVTIFFVARYFSMENKIADAREELRQYPVELVEAGPKVVQARIDSMRAVRKGYLRALDVLDMLLMGSDQWSQALAEISQETAAVRGVWVESWQPQGDEVLLTGTATTRDRIVRLAARLDGAIKEQSFSEIREWPVYAFSMTVPLDTGMPAATRYLRRQYARQQQAAAQQANQPPPTQPASLEDRDGSANR